MTRKSKIVLAVVLAALAAGVGYGIWRVRARTEPVGLEELPEGPEEGPPVEELSVPPEFPGTPVPPEDLTETSPWAAPGPEPGEPDYIPQASPQSSEVPREGEDYWGPPWYEMAPDLRAALPEGWVWGDPLPEGWEWNIPIGIPCRVLTGGGTELGPCPFDTANPNQPHIGSCNGRN